MKRDLIVDLMFIAGKCGAVKNVTMASHSSLSSQTLILQLNATIIGFMGRSKEEYTGIIYSSPTARGNSEGQPCSAQIRLKGPTFGRAQVFLNQV